MPSMASDHTALETILLKHSWISRHDLKRAHQYRKPGQSLADSLFEIRVIEPRRLAYALSEAFCLPLQTHLDEGTTTDSSSPRSGLATRARTVLFHWAQTVQT